MQQPKQSLQNACMHVKDGTAKLPSRCSTGRENEKLRRGFELKCLSFASNSGPPSEIGRDSAVPSFCER